MKTARGADNVKHSGVLGSSEALFFTFGVKMKTVHFCHRTQVVICGAACLDELQMNTTGNTTDTINSSCMQYDSGAW